VFVTLAAMAVQNRTIRLGPLGLCPETRHPALATAAASTLFELSDGRTFLGLGPCNRDAIRSLGIATSHPTRILREALQICRSLRAGDLADHHGECFTVTDTTVPFADATMEIWLASRRTKMLRVAGELADGVVLYNVDRHELAHAVRVVREAGDRAGHAVRLCWSASIVTSEAEMAALARGGPDRDDVIRGTPEQCASELGELLAMHGIDEFLLPVTELRFAVDTMESGMDVLTRL
jgi:alkanesulfonate monooxygenase SsuD/methylene tetrahydromethanopterin reductase-like flavin-dependent oxidoreductase (luciferase family)